FSIGRVGDLLDRIVPAVQDDPVRRSYCESRRQYALVPADENRRRAVVSDDLAQGEPKGARSDDKRSHPRRHRDAVQGVNRACIHVGQRRLFELHLFRQWMKVMNVSEVELGETGAGPAWLHGGAIGAKVARADAARHTVAAARELHRLDRDGLANGDAARARAQRVHDAGDLVTCSAWENRGSAPRITAEVAMQVRSTDS